VIPQDELSWPHNQTHHVQQSIERFRDTLWKHSLGVRCADLTVRDACWSMQGLVLDRRPGERQ
jgi:hypothetical protein